MCRQVTSRGVLNGTEEQGSSGLASAKAKHRPSPINPQALTKVLGDNAAAHLNVLQTFIAQSEDIIADFDTAYGQRDAEQVSYQARKLKSSARTVSYARHSLPL